MTKNYNPTADNAQRLVQKFGRQITLLRLEDTSSSKPWRGESDPRANPAETLVVSGVQVSVGQAAALGLASENEDFVQRSENVFIIAPGSNEQSDLTRFDEIEDQSQYWAIEKMNQLRPKDVNVLFYAFVRK